jgi:hypothetical protein
MCEAKPRKKGKMLRGKRKKGKKEEKYKNK